MKKSCTYIISDTHFNHKNIMKHCGRPKNYEDLILDSVSNIPFGYNLVHLGDFCLGRDNACHALFGVVTYSLRKFLMKGNHDEKPLHWYLDHGWLLFANKLYMSQKIGGKVIVFSHFPLPYDGSFDINIHGHFHNAPRENWEPNLAKLVTKDHHRLFSLENENYRAVELNEFLSRG